MAEQGKGLPSAEDIEAALERGESFDMREEDLGAYYDVFGVLIQYYARDQIKLTDKQYNLIKGYGAHAEHVSELADEFKSGKVEPREPSYAEEFLKQKAAGNFEKVPTP